MTGTRRATISASRPTSTTTTPKPEQVTDIRGARPLVMCGDMTTTDHISPIGTIDKGGAAGQYLLANGVAQKDFNNFGSRRSNHEVMIRGTFANIRFRNEMAPGTEGGFTRHMPDGKQMTVFDASEAYRKEGVPLVVIGGKDYGTGSSRDWAAKGTYLLGIRAVIAEGFERIHRSNLIGMGVLPLQFKDGMTRKTLKLDGTEVFDITGIEKRLTPRMDVTCRITRKDGTRGHRAARAASIPRSRSSTTSTAGCCTTCCGRRWGRRRRGKWRAVATPYLMRHATLYAWHDHLLDAFSLVMPRLVRGIKVSS